MVEPTPLHQSTKAAVMSLEMPDLPKGPFTVTVTGPDGKKMWEISDLDDEGNAPFEAMALGTGGFGMSNLVVNLLTGALRVFAGFVR